MDRKILIVTGDGGEGYEVLYAVHRFMEAGLVPVLAAPSKRLLNLVMHDFEPGWDTYVERPGYRREADIAIADAKSGDYEAILLAGGRAPEYLRNDPKPAGARARVPGAGQMDLLHLPRHSDHYRRRPRQGPPSHLLRARALRGRVLRRHLRRQELRARRQHGQCPDLARSPLVLQGGDQVPRRAPLRVPISPAQTAPSARRTGSCPIQVLAGAHGQLGQFALGADHVVDAFLEGAAGDEAVHLHVALLADAVGAVGGLRLDGGVPPQVEVDDVGGGGEVQAGAAGLQREQEDALAVRSVWKRSTISSRWPRATPPCRNSAAAPAPGARAATRTAVRPSRETG